MKTNLELLTRIRAAYTLGMGLLIAAVIGAYFLVDTRIHKREQDAALIYSVAQQRMWSQRILLLATRLASPDDAAGRDKSREDLNTALAEMRKSHQAVQAALQDPDARKSFAEVNALYFDGPASINNQVQAYLIGIERVAALRSDRLIANALAPDSSLRKQARNLLRGFQTAVQVTVEDSRNQVKSLQRLYRALVAGTVLLALALVFLVFRPMEQRILRERTLLRDMNARLEDLAEKRAAELMRSEVRAEGVLNTVLDGIITIDGRGIIQSFNPAAERLFGYAARAVIGQNVKILMPEPYHSEHDGYLQHYADTREARIIGTGREVTGKRRDGSTFPMELAVNEFEKGSGKGYVGIVHDITERKQAEAELRAVTAMRQAILDSANFSIIAANPEGVITVFNAGAQRMLGYTAEEVVGKLTPAAIHVPDEVVARARALSDELGKTIEPGFEAFVVKTRDGMPDENEWTYVRKDGSTYPVLLSVTALFDAAGAIYGYLGIGYDITERKRMELMKREFISTVSHELRTPLTSIRGALGLVAGGATGALPDKAKELINIASTNCDRLVRLINDILDMEKIESGKMVFDMRLLDLPALVNETIAANQAYAAQHQTAIVVDGELPDLRVMGDRDRLIQVMTNLLSNAAKFTPPGGSVHVSLEQRGAYARIAVRDEGPGIPEEFQSRLFQKFSQADSSDTRKKGGTGLGLSITKAIVEHLRGRISYQTEKNKGTTFFVDLPLQAAAMEISQKQGPRILIVEDDPDIAKLIRLILEQQGYAADTAGSVPEARERLAAATYAAMTLDLLLHRESGIGFLQQLRSNPETAALPVIVVSAVADEGRKLLENAAVLSVLDWLEKPIDEPRLLQAVSRAVKSGPRKGRRVLHVEDDLDIAAIVRAMLEGVADIELADSLDAARDRLGMGDYSLVILDIGLPDGSGLDLLPLLNAAEPPIPVLVFSAQEVDEDIRIQVSAAFVKSRTDEKSLVRAIRSSLEMAGPFPVDPVLIEPR
ncbi:MAG: PAS domain S-box protein [Thiobacillus sp.]|nr:PAS domain S-box protein [Thiobacillus sp.]